MFTEYAYTVTLQPKYYDFLPKEQIDFIISDMNSVSQYVNFDLRFELTKTGNIHAHGVIQLKRIIFNGYSQIIQIQCLFKNRKKYKIGYVWVKDITNREEWYQYCIKTSKITKDSLPNDSMLHIYTTGEGDLKFNKGFDHYIKECNDLNPEEEDGASYCGVSKALRLTTILEPKPIKVKKTKQNKIRKFNLNS